MPTKYAPMVIIQLFTTLAVNSLELCLQPISDFYPIHILALEFLCNFYVREKKISVSFSSVAGVLHDYLL